MNRLQRELVFVGLVTIALYGCSSDPLEEHNRKYLEAQKQALIEEEVEKKERLQATPLDFSQFRRALHRNIPVALIDPIVTLAHCEGDTILVSLPDEVACERGKQWVYLPSQRIIPSAEMLLVSLRFTGLAVALYSSIAEAKQAGAKVAILPVVVRADATVLSLRDFYKERHIDAEDLSDGALSRAIATVKLHAAIVRLDAGQIAWKGSVEQVMEQTVLTLPIAESRGFVESGAGIGKFEVQAYGVRSVIVQAYTQIARTLAKQVDESLRETVR